jgi:hypothetical protein
MTMIFGTNVKYVTSVTPDPKGSRARQLQLQQKKDEVNRLRVLQDHAKRGDFEVQRQVNQDREDARKQAKKREADTKKMKSQGGTKQGTEDGGEVAGWIPIPMRDDQGHVVYDQEGNVRYLPHNGPTKKKKKPPAGRPDSPPSPTRPMATSTPTTTRTLIRVRTTPHHLRDYVHGADLDSDSLGLLPLADYNQSDLSDLLNNSIRHIQEQIRIQEEETRAQDA